MATSLIRVVVFALLLLVPMTAGAFEQSSLTIVRADGERFDFQIEVAVTFEDRALGLMYRETLADDAGMLFVYDPEQPVTMWMKNTLLPLDMLFLGNDGRIVGFAENTVPLSEAHIASIVPVKGVLEVKAGTVKRLGLAVGDRILQPLLVP